MAQELLLLAVIDVRFISEDLISLFQGLGFVGFNVMDFLFSLLPAEYQGQAGYNVLTDNAQYHPNIFSLQPNSPNSSMRYFLSARNL